MKHIKSKITPEKYLLLLIDCAKAFDYVDHNKLWKTLKEMGIPDHLTCPLRNLYAGQEATFRTLYGTTGEKAMVPHSRTVAQKIPWMEEPGRLQSMGSLRVRHY